MGGLGLALAKGFRDVLGTGTSDALVNLECLPQAGGGFAGIAVLHVALADSFQGARLGQGCTDLVADG
jgi:hypothetical protein